MLSPRRTTWVFRRVGNLRWVVARLKNRARKEGVEDGMLPVTGKYRMRNPLNASDPRATVLWAELSLLSSERAEPRRKGWVRGAQQQKMEDGGGVGTEKEDAESGQI